MILEEGKALRWWLSRSGAVLAPHDGEARLGGYRARRARRDPVGSPRSAPATSLFDDRIKKSAIEGVALQINRSVECVLCRVSGDLS
jgi:hypothetical protein